MCVVASFGTFISMNPQESHMAYESKWGACCI